MKREQETPWGSERTEDKREPSEIPVSVTK